MKDKKEIKKSLERMNLSKVDRVALAKIDIMALIDEAMALIDEATDYEDVRAPDALISELEKIKD